MPRSDAPRRMFRVFGGQLRGPRGRGDVGLSRLGEHPQFGGYTASSSFLHRVKLLRARTNGIPTLSTRIAHLGNRLGIFRSGTSTSSTTTHGGLLSSTRRSNHVSTTAHPVCRGLLTGSQRGKRGTLRGLSPGHDIVASLHIGPANRDP